MQSLQRRKRNKPQAGFTLIELILCTAILGIVIGVVFDGLVKLMQRNNMETAKVDLTQESRQFLDQIVNDIHQSGYPSAKMFDSSTLVPPPVFPNPPDCNLYLTIACGLVNATSTSLQFEGDVDGSGTVSEVFVQLSPLNGPCPCTIQRGTVTKAEWKLGTVPYYYTEVNNVTNTNIFLGYDTAGNTAALTGTPAHNLAAIEITLSVRSPTPDVNGAYPTITMSTAAKIQNIN